MVYILLTTIQTSDSFSLSVTDKHTCKDKGSKVMSDYAKPLEQQKISLQILVTLNLYFCHLTNICFN